MKTFFFFSLLCVSSVFAQETTVFYDEHSSLSGEYAAIDNRNYLTADSFSGKPIYQIQVRRADTVLGNIAVELFPLVAPMMVHVFDSLVAMSFYDTTAFHRVIPGFVIQGGDPNSRHGDVSTWGYGDPSQGKVPAEFSAALHLRGILSMARTSEINSATSQFFICIANQPTLDGKYTIFGRVISGMDVADKIVNAPRNSSNRPLVKIEMFVTKTGTNDSVPTEPLLVSPIDGITDVGTSQRLTWNAVPSAVMYTVQVATDSAFQNITYTKNVGKVMDTVRNLQQNGKTYYWRVIANNGGHLSTWSQTRKFTTAGSSSVHDEIATPLVSMEQNSPNPCSQLTVISCSRSAGSGVMPATFEVRDMLGRIMYQTTISSSQQIIIDVSGFRNGVYSYTLRSGSIVQTKRMIIAK